MAVSSSHPSTPFGDDREERGQKRARSGLRSLFSGPPKGNDVPARLSSQVAGGGMPCGADPRQWHMSCGRQAGPAGQLTTGQPKGSQTPTQSPGQGSRGGKAPLECTLTSGPIVFLPPRVVQLSPLLPGQAVQWNGARPESGGGGTRLSGRGSPSRPSPSHHVSPHYPNLGNSTLLEVGQG